MKKKKRRTVWYILAGTVFAIQFIPIDKPGVNTNNPNDLLKNNNIPITIALKLRESCYDCHSNETIFPWYSKITPVNLLINKDIKKGRTHLNFSDWQSKKKIERATDLDKISTVVNTGEMPLKIYSLMHSKSHLTEKDKKDITGWAEQFAEKIFK